MTSAGRWQLPVALAVVCAGVRLAAYLGTGYQVDDALITFRYAENLAAGLGFVYNTGEHVLGTTTPLFTLVLALFKLLGLSVPIAAIAISLAASAATALALIRFAAKAGFEKYSLIPALVYTFYPRSIICDISGLETALFTFLMLFTIYKLYSREFLAASLAASLAAVTRPEGIGLVLLVVAIAVTERVGRSWRLLTAPVVLIGSWLAFSKIYFGSLLPNSMIAKAALYQSSDSSLLTRLAEMTTIGGLFGGIALGVLGAVLVWLIARRDRMALVFLTALGFITALALFSPRVFFWYLAPIVPLLAIAMLRPFRHMLDQLRLPSVSVIATSVIVIILAPLAFIHVERLAAEMRWYRSNHIAAAEYLNKYARQGDKVLAEDIGHFGYHYRGEIIDRDGLITPQAIDYNRRGASLEFADSVSADWIFVAVDYPNSKSILESPLFATQYEVATFSTSDAELTHRLYRRR